MALVTEASLREAYGDATDLPISRYEVPAGTVVTPAARTWLIDRRVDLVIGSKVIVAVPRGSGADPAAPATPPPPVVPPAPLNLAPVASAPSPAAAAPTAVPAPAPSSGEASALPAFTKPEAFDVIDGSTLAEKPEHLTALRGNLLVAKNHPQIRFRGQVDAFEADLIVAQVAFKRLGLDRGVAELGEVLRYVRQILRCEVLDVPFEDIRLFGLDHTEIRHRSHYPKEYYGLNHFAASVDDGEAVVLLNQLRTKSREVELAAYTAFDTGGTGEPSRLDLIRALNRLSSAIYLMMFKAKTKEYEG